MSEKQQLWIVSIFSIGTPVLWFAVTTLSHNAPNAGRGGAVGTAFALAFMFVNRDYGTKLYVALTERMPNLKQRIQGLLSQDSSPQNKVPVSVEDVKKELDLFVDAVALNARGQRRQNIFLAIATFLSTILWGFGDIFAALLQR